MVQHLEDAARLPRDFLFELLLALVELGFDLIGDLCHEDHDRWLPLVVLPLDLNVDQALLQVVVKRLLILPLAFTVVVLSYVYHGLRLGALVEKFLYLGLATGNSIETLTIDAQAKLGLDDFLHRDCMLLIRVLCLVISISKEVLIGSLEAHVFNLTEHDLFSIIICN